MRDLYTTILHEACHLLGVYSLIDASSSNASLLSSVGSTAAYSKYDTRIRTIGGTTNTDNDSPNYIRYPTALPYLAQVAGNSFINQPQCSSNTELFGASLPSQPLYLPFPWNSSGLSHLNCNPSSADGCATSNGFIMNSCGPAGYNQRHPNQQEVKLLCELGYSLSGTFGTTQFAGTGGHLPWQTYEPCGTGCRAVGVNDVILAEASTNGPPLVVDAATFLSNDVNTTGYVPNSFQMVASNLPVGQITDRGNGLGFSFVPNGQVIGWGVARYLPRCADGSPGDWAYLFLPIVPVGLDELDCPFTVDCNLVCDGDFEASNEALAAAHYDFNYGAGNIGFFVSPDPIRSETNFQFPVAQIPYCDVLNTNDRCLAIRGRLILDNAIAAPSSTDWTFLPGEVRMQPGAEIAVDPQARVRIDGPQGAGNPVVFSGCEMMWAGFNMGQGASIEIARTTIMDAQAAFRLGSRSVLAMRENILQRNFVGVYHWGDGGFKLISQSDVFDGLQPLLPPFDAFAVAPMTI